MFKQMLAIIGLFVLLGGTGCREDEPAAPVAEEATAVPVSPTVGSPPTESAPESIPAAEGVVISEVLVGVPGDNTREFIELYNASTAAIDLDGYSLWYKNRPDQDEQLIYAWQGRTDLPPLGHLLLAPAKQDFGLLPDVPLSTPLYERTGGLLLRDREGQPVTQFGWGEAPQEYFSGSPLPVPGEGASMERVPGGEAGHGVDSGDNTADFTANANPNPQNSGSSPTPLADEHLAISLTAPETVEPGVEFDLIVAIENQSDEPAAAVEVALPTIAGFSVVSAADGATETDGYLVWTIPALAGGETIQETITLQSPFTYVDSLLSGTYAEAEDFLRVYSAPRLMTMAGGAIPIATARELQDSTVSVEGIASMYTGGFFAGSSATKFYIEDDSGGIQVYVPGGRDEVIVNIGDRVRVTGNIELYRDSIEIIPGDFATEVELLAEAAGTVQPAIITPLDNENNADVIGRLNSIEGTATRIDEFTYSYEIDLMDDSGNQTLVYIEKDTGVTAEPLEVGDRYLVTGISEFYSSDKQLKPRLQSDIKKIYPPVLLLDIQAANSVQPGQVLSYTITATNHTAETLNNVQISAPAPVPGAAVAEIGAGGTTEESKLRWTIEELAGDGGSVAVGFNVIVDENAVQPLELGQVTAVAEQWPEAATTEPYLTFVGSGVPIWAIQGTGDRSPYVLDEATTTGIVSSVFPELQGFWIQEAESDDDPATSSGLFVLYGDQEVSELPVMEGDLVQVTGRVREISGQTTLHTSSTESIIVLDEEQPLPQAMTFDPPRENETAQVYKESLEGMLVSVPEQAVVLAPTTPYGEYVLLLDRWDVESVRRGEATGFFIFVDDGSEARHEEQATLPYAVQKGDRVEGVSGPLAYTFEQYKIEPLTDPVIVSEERPLPPLDPLEENQFSVATFNVENLFDNRDPHPDSPPRPNKAEYERKLSKIAEAIAAMGAPSIIGLQEVENIGVLEDLAAVEQLLSFGYQPYLIEGPDARGIDVAYLVRADQVTVEEANSYPEPTGLTTRPPLVITATVQLDAGSQTVYLLNNHFSSLSSGEAATEPRRSGQAAWNVTLMDQIREQDPEAQFIVMGDLNSFLDTPPLDTLKMAGLRHAYEFFANEEDIPYTYIFQGATQTLDHILMSETLFEQLSSVTTLPIDADYPIAAGDDGSARRVSDHDPLLALFTIEGD